MFLNYFILIKWLYFYGESRYRFPISMTYSQSRCTWCHVMDSVPQYPRFFSSCSWCQPYCCYQIESRVRACGFSLPFISTKHYRCAGAQPSSYFPSCPLYIYRCLWNRVAVTLRVFLRSVHRLVTLLLKEKPKISELIKVSLRSDIMDYILYLFICINGI